MSDRKTHNRCNRCEGKRNRKNTPRAWPRGDRRFFVATMIAA